MCEFRSIEIFDTDKIPIFANLLFTYIYKNGGVESFIELNKEDIFNKIGFSEEEIARQKEYLCFIGLLSSIDKYVSITKKAIDRFDLIVKSDKFEPTPKPPIKIKKMSKSRVIEALDFTDMVKVKLYEFLYSLTYRPKNDVLYDNLSQLLPFTENEQLDIIQKSIDNKYKLIYPPKNVNKSYALNNDDNLDRSNIVISDDVKEF